MQRAGYDPNEVEKNFLRALRIDGIEKFYPGPEKMPAPKDPRVQLEEMRLKGKAMQLAHDKQMFALDLMEQRRVNTAKIRQLTAQAMKLASEVGTAGAGLRLKAIDTPVAALQAHNDMISQKLEATEEGSEDDTERGGVSGVAEPVDDSGILEAAEEMAGGPEGAMGAEVLPE